MAKYRGVNDFYTIPLLKQVAYTYRHTVFSIQAIFAWVTTSLLFIAVITISRDILLIIVNITPIAPLLCRNTCSIPSPYDMKIGTEL